MDIKLDKENQIVSIVGDRDIVFVEAILKEYNVEYKKQWRGKFIQTRVFDYEPIGSQYYNTEYIIDINDSVSRRHIFSFYLIKGLIEGLSKVQIEENEDEDK